MAMIKPTLFALETLHLKKLGSSRSANPGSPYLSQSFKQVVSNSYSLHKSSSPSLDFSVDARKLVEDFNPKIPLQEALTPPSSWYTDPSFLALEFDRVFYRGWQVVGFTEQIKDPHDFFTGRCSVTITWMVAIMCHMHIQIFENVSIQSCQSCSTERESDFDRLGSKALYAFIYPNFMINRYGPWMDTNLVLPLGPRKCQVIFDYFLEASLKDDNAFVEQSLQESERVQMEDIELCEGVQGGLESPAYCTGRYAPTLEKAMHHFHCLLYENLLADV